MCSNGTRVFIQRTIYDKVVGLLVERAKKIKLGDPHHEDTRMGAMINTIQTNKVMGYIENAKIEVCNYLWALKARPSVSTRNASHVSKCLS